MWFLVSISFICFISTSSIEQTVPLTEPTNNKSYITMSMKHFLSLGISAQYVNDKMTQFQV